MVPSRGLVSNGYCIPDPDRTKLLYFVTRVNDTYDPSDGGDISIKLSGLDKSYDAKWFDPRNGSETSVGSIEGGSDYKMTPPCKDDWVLLLMRAGNGGPSEPPISSPKAPTGLTILSN